jgi:hypothetical protein
MSKSYTTKNIVPPAQLDRLKIVFRKFKKIIDLYEKNKSDVKAKNKTTMGS